MSAKHYKDDEAEEHDDIMDDSSDEEETTKRQYAKSSRALNKKKKIKAVKVSPVLHKSKMSAKRYIDDEAEEDDNLVDNSSNEEETTERQYVKSNRTLKKKTKAVKVSPEKRQKNQHCGLDDDDDDDEMFSLMDVCSKESPTNIKTVSYRDKYTNEIYSEYFDGALLAMHVRHKNSSDGAFVMQAVVGYRKNVEVFTKNQVKFLSTLAENKGSNIPKSNQRDTYPTHVFIVPITSRDDKVKTKEGLLHLLQEMMKYLNEWNYRTANGLYLREENPSYNQGIGKYNNYIIGPAHNETHNPRRKLGDVILEDDAIDIVQTLYSRVSGPRMYDTHKTLLEKYFSPPYSVSLHEKLGFPLGEI